MYSMSVDSLADTVTFEPLEKRLIHCGTIGRIVYKIKRKSIYFFKVKCSRENFQGDTDS